MIWRLGLILLFLCLFSVLVRADTFHLNNLYQLKLKLLIETNMQLPALPNNRNHFPFSQFNKNKIFLSETKNRLHNLFSSFERDLVDSQQKLGKVLSSLPKNVSTSQDLDCCQNVQYSGNKSNEFVNKAVACQRTFTIEHGHCQSSMHLSTDVINNWKRKDMIQEHILEQWYSSMHRQCVKTFVYPAKKDQSLCIETTGLHNLKKEAIANTLLPRRRNWAFLFDVDTFLEAGDEKSATLLLGNAAGLAFSTVQFASPRDYFFVSGLHIDRQSTDIYHCNNSENVKELFSSYSLPGNAKKLFTVSSDALNTYPKLSEQMERLLRSIDSEGQNGETILLLFTWLRPSDVEEQHRKILQFQSLFANIHLVVFRMGNVILPLDSLNDDYWTHQFNISVRSKNVELVTPSRQAKTLNFPQIFPRSQWGPLQGHSPRFHYTYPDDKKESLSISMVVSDSRNEYVDGVVGIDIKYSRILGEINYHTTENMTLFVTDAYGSVIYHRSITYRRSQGFIPITFVEPALSSFFQEEQLSPSKFFSNILDTGETKDLAMVLNGTEFSYSCSRLASSPFVVCSSFVGSQYSYDISLDPRIENFHVDSTFEPNIIYHSSITSRDDKSCKYFGQLSVSEVRKIALFVSKRALLLYTTRLDISMRDSNRFEMFFQKLYDGWKTEEIFKNISKISLYHLRSVALKWGADKSFENASFIRRYAATNDGFMIMQPAARLDTDMDINDLNWYKKATKSDGIHFSSPWLDTSEAGYVLSVSWKVPLSNYSFIVVGFDITVESLYSHFLYNTQKAVNPECQPEIGKDCFLFNDEGNLVAHPRIWNASIDSKGISGWHWRTINIFSLAYRETEFFSFVSKDSSFFSPSQCYDYNSMERRFAQHFRPSYVSDNTQLKFGSGNATLFNVRRLKGTNLLLGIKAVPNFNALQNRFCFCASSHREECFLPLPYFNECWCSCTIPHDVGHQCRQEAEVLQDHWSPCDKESELLQFQEKRLTYAQSKLGQCVDFNCHSIAEQSACDQSRGCRWCEYEKLSYSSNQSEPIVPLARPYCERLDHCFMRIHNFYPYPSIYTPGARIANIHHGSSSTTTPIGPVAGGVLASSIVIALAVFLIRHERQRRNLVALYNANYTSDVNVQVAVQEIDDHSLEQDEDDIGYLNMLHPLPVIAVRNERRHPHLRNYGTDSDHGYSTMSPHEDSEPNPGAYSDATSVDRSVVDQSSPTDEESERSSTCTGVSASTIAKAKKIAHQSCSLQKTSCKSAPSSSRSLHRNTAPQRDTKHPPTLNVVTSSDAGSVSEVEAEVHTAPVTNTVPLAFC